MPRISARRRPAAGAFISRNLKFELAEASLVTKENQDLKDNI
jgi:hypothetical protein